MTAPLSAQQSISQVTTGLEKRDGLFPLYWDAARGRLLLEIPRFGQDFLYLTSLATGLGSNTVGLDRGLIGDEYLARFERVGPKVLLVFRNPRFRAGERAPEALIRSVEESFATSTAGAFDVLGEEGGRVVIDATPHFLGDPMGVVQRLQGAGQGAFALSRERSVIHLPRTKGFPRNTEVEAALTFTSNNPGPLVRQHAPDGGAVTLREHHSLVQLPDTGFVPRLADPRIGNIPVSIMDFSRALDQGYDVRYAIRHRLLKRNPAARMSEPVTPITYYIDPAVPEPYRAAFHQGAGWWNKVFEAAGFINGFRVAEMPADMDPMDARYNVVQWVQRSDPGFSIGPTFVDPRTGEILKAAVRMDTYRSITDYNIYAGLLPATAGIDDGQLDYWFGTLEPNVSAEEFAMARRRQHVAHEIGHTIGLAHNFIAESDGRSSVMDYPAPWIRLTGGRIDLSQAYRNGPGAYDSIAIRYAYTVFPAGQEATGLRAIVTESMSRGLRFLTDGDNATSGSFPEVTQWLAGSDGVEELLRTMEVRRLLMTHFDERALKPGEPMVQLNQRFVPVYLHHRYALEAAIKAIGGMEYRFAVRGDTLAPTRIIAPERQLRALRLVLDALEPAELAVPERVTRLMAPRAYGVSTNEWSLGSDARPAFDRLGAARTLATTIVSNVLDSRRTARLADFHARDGRYPALEDVIAQLVDRTWVEPSGTDAALRRVVQRVTVDELTTLAGNTAASVESRAAAEWGLRRIKGVLEARRPGTSADAAHLTLAGADIQRFLDRPDNATGRTRALPQPPGTPIGHK